MAHTDGRTRDVLVLARGGHLTDGLVGLALYWTPEEDLLKKNKTRRPGLLPPISNCSVRTKFNFHAERNSSES